MLRHFSTLLSGRVVPPLSPKDFFFPGHKELGTATQVKVEAGSGQQCPGGTPCPYPDPPSHMPANQVLPAVTQPYAWRVSVGTCLHTWVPGCSVCTHVWSVCSQVWWEPGATVASGGLPHSFPCPSPLWSTVFSCVWLLETEVETNGDTRPQGPAVWVGVHLCECSW